MVPGSRPFVGTDDVENRPRAIPGDQRVDDFDRASTHSAASLSCPVGSCRGEGSSPVTSRCGADLGSPQNSAGVCASPSGSEIFTPAFEMLYAVSPGGQVIPCFETGG